MHKLLNTNRAVLSWTIVALFFFYDYLLKFSVSVLKPDLMSEFNLSTTEFGLTMSMYMMVYTIMQIPAGVMVDRWGPRKIITFACLSCATGCFLFAYAENLIPLLIGRTLIGFGASFALVTCSKLATIWFSTDRFSFLFGCMITLAFIGGVFGINITTFLMSIWNWRDAMEIAGALYLIMALLMWIVVRDVNPGRKDKYLTENVSMKQLLRELLSVAIDKQAWLAAMYAGFMFVPTTILAFWGVSYLSEVNNIPLDTAGGLTSVIFIGWMIGAPAYGAISDWLRKRKALMYFATISSLFFSSILIYVDNLSYPTIAFLMFMVGLCSSGFALAFTVIKESYDIALVGAAMGFMNTVNTLFETTSVVAVGTLIDLQLGETMLENYNYAFSLVPVSAVLSLLALKFIKSR